MDFDIVVIGGGIHGVGVAQAGAAAGYRTLLLEERELAAGTSGRSSKLIHGGLRYLETASIGLVRESLAERELLLKLAPSLVRRQRFHIPVYPETSRRPWMLRIGLTAYALLAGAGPNVRFRTLPRSEWDDLDGLKTDRLQQVFEYVDAQTDDAALTRAVMRSATELGAELCCPARFRKATIDADGCSIEFERDGKTETIRAATIVNAAGPWAARVASAVSPQPSMPRIDLVSGSHLELPGSVDKGCYYVEAPSDGRAVFVMPWRDRTLLGTTEEVYGDDPAEVRPLQRETSYLLDVLAHYFPERSREVLDAWAGLRVLPATGGVASRRSRETMLPIDDRKKPRFLSILGGKLTGYRATADRVIRTLQPTLPRRARIADTRELPLG